MPTKASRKPWKGKKTGGLANAGPHVLPEDPKIPIYFHHAYEDWGEFCQWYNATFFCPRLQMTFNCTEQYMMYHKTLLDRSPDAATRQQEVMETHDPRTQKVLGRQCNLKGTTWEQDKFDVVVEGNMLKFGQIKKLRKLLLSTGDRLLVESSASDRQWGIGYNKNDAGANRENWGQNLLGKALMTVRANLQEDDEGEEKTAEGMMKEEKAEDAEAVQAEQEKALE